MRGGLGWPLCRHSTGGISMSMHEHPGQDAQARAAEKKRMDRLLDEALAESFPASDPPSTLTADEPVQRKEPAPQQDDSNKS